MQQLSVILKKSVISVPLFLNDSSHLSLFSQTDTFIPNSYHLLRQNLIFALLKKQTKKNRAVFWCWSARLKHMNNHTARNVYVFWLSRINPREKRVSLLMKKPLLYPAGKQRKREEKQGIENERGRWDTERLHEANDEDTDMRRCQIDPQLCNNLTEADRVIRSVHITDPGIVMCVNSAMLYHKRVWFSKASPMSHW